MAKTAPRSRSEELRYLAGLSSRKPDDARAAWEAFVDEVEAVRVAADAWEATDLSSISEQLGTLNEALQALSQAGAQVDGLDALVDAANQVDVAQGGLGVDSDALSTFTEAYDELESALDTYDEYRETGSGYSREDREEAWGTVTEQMEALADAADQLGFDWTPTEPATEPAMEGPMGSE
jgi:hypothetical protein